MSTPSLSAEIFYPESDGQPMAETDLHAETMSRILDKLRYRYEGQQVYVSGNVFFYYIEGDPKRFLAPDGFVVLGIRPGHRDTYLLWLEGKPPNVVFEVTSKSTRSIDETIKPEIYRKIGVAECFMFDPTADYLNPPLLGYRLTPQGYVRIEPNLKGQLECEQLGLLLETGGPELLLRDRSTGLLLETRSEAAQRREMEERLAREAAQRREMEERLAREAAQRREMEERLAREAAQRREMEERLAREAAQRREVEERLAKEAAQHREMEERLAREAAQHREMQALMEKRAAELEAAQRRSELERERIAKEAAEHRERAERAAREESERTNAELIERIRRMEAAIAQSKTT